MTCRRWNWRQARQTQLTPHTAAAFSDETLRCARDALGEDNVMYSIDYPFESTIEATEWLDVSKLDAHVRAKIEHENARALSKLNQPDA